jgi:CheY-like chemotaxis protein
VEVRNESCRVRPRVLVIDDEELITYFVRRVLEDECDVVTVNAGREAVARVAGGERFDVVFCDLLMPDMDSRDVHDALVRAAPGLARCIVVMTGGVLDPDLARFAESLPTEVLRKPLERARLRAAVREYAGEPAASRPTDAG